MADFHVQPRMVAWLLIAVWHVLRPTPALCASDLRAVANRSVAERSGASRVEHWPFRTRDLDGNVHHPGDSATVTAWTFLFLSPKCDRSSTYLSHLERLATAYEEAGIDFLVVISDPEVSRLEAVAWRDRHRLRFPVICDSGQVLSRILDATHTPQAIVVDASGSRLYSGKIDDRPYTPGDRRARPKHIYLGTALRSITAHRNVTVRRTEPTGRPIDSRSEGEKHRQVTWNRQIAPLIWTHCADCHRTGGLGPFPLTTYDEVRRHGRALVEAAESRKMPPWKPVPGFSELKHSRRLSGVEIELLADWVNSGLAEGSSDDLAPAPDYGSGWVLGEPDLVLTVPEGVLLPATGPAFTRSFVLPTGFETDRLVAAVEFRPRVPAAIARATYLVDDSGTARRLDLADPDPGFLGTGGTGFVPSGALGGWAPTATAARLPAGCGRDLPRGADIVLQIQYQPMGLDGRDEPALGIYFAPAAASRKVGEIVVANPTLKIPPGTARHRHRARYELPVPTTIVGLAPHLRELGREVVVTAVLPDGTFERLLRIEAWDPQWHEHYYLRRPIRFPAGTRIELDAIFDNSSRNPRQTSDPPQLVRWGDVPGGEVAVCYLQVATDSEEDFVQLIRHNQTGVAANPEGDAQRR